MILGWVVFIGIVGFFQPVIAQQTVGVEGFALTKNGISQSEGIGTKKIGTKKEEIKSTGWKVKSTAWIESKEGKGNPKRSLKKTNRLERTYSKLTENRSVLPKINYQPLQLKRVRPKSFLKNSLPISSVSKLDFFLLCRLVTGSLKYQIQQNQISLFKARLREAQGKRLGKLEISYSTLHLFEQPIIKMELAQPVGIMGNRIIYRSVNAQIPMGSREQFEGEVSYSYPIFTGFALTHQIKKRELELVREKLKLANLRRQLILKTTQIYTSLYRSKAQISALQEAYHSLLVAYKKGKALFQEGIINRSQLEAISAKVWKIKAEIEEEKAKRQQLLNLLSYFLNRPVREVGKLPIEFKNFNPISLSPEHISSQLLNRPDVAILREELKIADQQIKIVYSQRYPKIGLKIGWKREGENLFLNRNRYSNLDRSYIGIGFKYTLWDGGVITSRLDQVKSAKLAKLLYYQDYLNFITEEYKNRFLAFKALLNKLKWAKAELHSRQLYLDYLKGKFQEGLTDGETLSRGIAKLAEAKAQLEEIKGRLFYLWVWLKLDQSGTLCPFQSH